ncbi:MAG: hypothetical protein V1729_04140 [Candidatus Woesearchaeota archaeon]
MKKAQIAGQIFIYMMAVVVVGLIIAYGYSAIKSFSDKGQEVESITLRKSLENSVKAITSDYGSIKRPDTSIPGKYEFVCFTDKARIGDADNTAFCGAPGGDPRQYYPIACAAWKTGRDNIFLVPDGSDSFDVGEIVIKDNQPFICLEVINNKIKLQLEGLGDRVQVSQYS